MVLMHDIEDIYYLYVFLQKWHSIVQFSKILDTTFKSVLSFQFKKKYNQIQCLEFTTFFSFRRYRECILLSLKRQDVKYIADFLTMTLE